MKDSFHNRLLESMRIRNTTQAQLARETGMSKSRINHYCSGLYKPNPDGVYLIAKALNISEEWLMGYDVPMERADTGIHSLQYALTSDEENLLDSYRKLNQEGQSLTNDFINMLSARYSKNNKKQ